MMYASVASRSFFGVICPIGRYLIALICENCPCLPLPSERYARDKISVVMLQRWSNRTRVLVLVLEYEYFLSTRTRVRRKVIVLILEYITKVIVLAITSHDDIFFI